MEAFLKLNKMSEASNGYYIINIASISKKEAERCNALIEQLKETTADENTKMEELAETCTKWKRRFQW